MYIRQTIETALFGQIKTLFSLPDSVTLFDLTNTYFEGEMASNAKAKRGRSKEKRSDCPLVTLGLVLDGSGFVRRSKMFEGNVSEAKTLEEMLKGVEVPAGVLVIMDAGIATQANIVWLVEHQYRYLVVSRERNRQFEEMEAVETATASQQTIQIQRVLIEDGAEARLYCHSEARQEKETAMTTQFAERFEAGLTKIAAGLDKKRCEKRLDKLWERIGRLKAKGITSSWISLRQTLSVQQRVTATFKQRDDRTLHVRKGTVAEPKLQELYGVLGLSSSPGGIQKSVI
jgi:transposase